MLEQLEQPPPAGMIEVAFSAELPPGCGHIDVTRQGSRYRAELALPGGEASHPIVTFQAGREDPFLSPANPGKEPIVFYEGEDLEMLVRMINTVAAMAVSMAQISK
jgi:hypothetical protein